MYRINDQLALVQTVDFFPPMVDDPYLFGQIAAANALSDVYAMGGRPSHALNLLCYPECLEPPLVARILEGGYAKVAEAGAVVAGGHSISAREPMYGLCVSGFVDPRRVLTNRGVRAGDRLILTKPLGSGILVTAAKGDVIDAAALQPAIDTMTQLNRYAAEITADYDIHACTDVTGFGLLGHALEMLGDSASLALDSRSLPLIEGAYEMAAMGLIPAGAYHNRNYVAERVRIAPEADPVLIDIACDPQTSGGLLLAVAAEQADDLLAALRRQHAAASLIGEAIAGEGLIEVR